MSKEFYFQFDAEVLQRGLKAHEGDRIPAVEVAYNLECSPQGLVPYTPLKELVEYSQQWPFPWARSEQGLTYSFRPTDSTTAELLKWDGQSSEHVADVTFPSFNIEDRPDMASFGEYVVLTGTFGVLRGTGTDLSTVSTSVMPEARSCCNFKGQLIMGGILSDWYDCDETFVAFSNIGDITMIPDYKNEAGYIPIKYVGKVRRVLRLDKGVAVYGDEGAGLLVPVTSPAPTYGLRELANFPLASPASVDGGIGGHVALDAEGNLWVITEGEGAKKLGYKDILSELSLSDTVITRDNLNRRFYICDGERSFVFRREGLTECYQIVSAVVHTDGEAYGLFEEESEEGAIKVGPLDFGYRGLKALFTVESDSGDEVTIFSGNPRGEFSEIKTVPFNNVGFATPIVTGEAFKLLISADSYEDMYPTNILCRWKMADMRGMRGYYQPQRT